MIKTNVLLINVTKKQRNVFIPLETAMITTHVLKIHATQEKDVFILKSPKMN
jgi:hypothetical protein